MALVRTARSRRSRAAMAAATLAAAVMLGYAALHAPPARRLALRLLVSRLERAGLVARADSLDYSLAALRFHLTNVTVATAARAGEPFFTARDIRITLARSILIGRIEATDLALDDPRVTLAAAAADTAESPRARAPAVHAPEASPLPRMRIGHARVTNLAFGWRDVQSSADVSVSFELTSNGNGARGPITSTRPARLAWRGRRTTIDAIDGRLSWNGSDLGVDGLRLRLPEGTAVVEGRVDALASTPRLEAHLVADANLVALAPWLSIEGVLDGTSHADLRLVGLLSRPDAAFALTGRNIAVAGFSGVSFAAEGRAADGTAVLTHLRADIAHGSVSASGQLALDGPGSIRASWQGVDLASVVRGALIAARSSASVRPAAILSGTVEARWRALRLDSVALAADARAVRDVRGTTATLPVDGSLRLEVRARSWQLSSGDIGTDGARLAGRVRGSIDPRRIADSTIAGSIHVSADDARRLAGALTRARLLATAPAIGGRAAGDFTVGGLVGAPSLDGPVRATLRYATLPPADIRATASITPDGVRAGGIDVRSGVSTARGVAGWSKGSDELSGAIDGSIALIDVAGALTANPKGLPADGRVEASASLSGTLAHATAIVAASGAALEVAGQHIDRASLGIDADLTGSRFIVDSVTLESGRGRVEGRGEVDLTRDTYTAHVAASDVPISPLPGVIDTPISASLSGSFDGEGSFANLGGAGHLSLAEARWNGLDLGSIAADVRLEGRSASISAGAPELALAASGSIGIDATGAIALRGAWTPRDLFPIARRLGAAASAPVSGSASLSFELSGSRERPDGLHGAAALEGLDVTAAGQRIRLASPGRFEYDGGTFRAGTVALGFGSSTLVIDGEAGEQTGRTLTASLDGPLADFGFVGSLVRRGQSAGPLPAPAGAVQARVSVSGPLTRPVVSGTFQVVEGRVPLTARQAVTGVNLRGRLDAGALVIESAAAEFEGASLTASARVPGDAVADRLPAWLRQRLASAAGPATLTARLQSITPAVATSLLDARTLAQISGRLDATVHLEADRPALDRLRGTLTLDRSDLELGGVGLVQQVPTRLALENGRLAVESWEWGRDDNRLVVRGGATLRAPASLDLVATSVLDLRALDVLARPARLTGRADAEVRIGGTVRSPTLDGWVTLGNGEARIASPRLVVGDIAGTVTLAADTVTFQRIFASVNGGPSEIAGTLRHRWFTPLGGRVTMVGSGAALDLQGLRAEADIDVAFDATPGRPVIDGAVTLVRSAFRDPLSLTAGLLRSLQASALPPAVVGSPLDDLRLDVRVVTQDDLVVDNNYGKLEASADVRLVGTVSSPSLLGRATLGAGGWIVFGTRRYRLEENGTGEGNTIDFANPLHIEPDLNLSAVTSVAGTDVTLKITGTPSTLQTDLRSPNHPEYTQSDLVSLLLTGRTAATAATSSEMEGIQLVGLLSGELLGTAGQALGLTTLRVESGSPDIRFDAGLVATETNPGARLTVGRNVGSRVEVVFSQSLAQSGRLTWIVTYAPRSNFNLRVVSYDNDDRVYDFRHDLTLGRPASERRPVPQPRQTVVSVQLGGAGTDEHALLSRLALVEGHRFSFFRWQDDRERIEEYYHARDRLEARVAARRIVDPNDMRRVSLIYDIRPGPQTTVRLQGVTLPAAAVREIKLAWAGSVADDFLEDEAVRIARGALVDEGYVQAAVGARIERAPDAKQLTILVETGTRARDRQVRFAGNRGEPARRLLAVLSQPRLARAVWIEPDVVRDALLAFYRANGYLNADVRIDPVSRDDGTVVRAIQIDEGEPIRIRDIRVEGATALSPADVIARAGVSHGDVLTESRLDRARVALDRSYRRLGFNNVAITLRGETSPAGTDVDLSVRVDEGSQQRLRDIVTMGVEHTRPSLVSRALRLTVGQPVDLAAWNEARRRLYETGAFRSVDIEREVVGGPPGETPATREPPVEPVRALIRVQEWPRFRVRYGLEVNDTAHGSGSDPGDVLPASHDGGRAFSLGATSDFSARNLLGRAVTAGVAGRYMPDFRAARAYATMPTLLGRRITSTLFLERSRQDSGTTATGIHPRIGTDITSFTFEQRIRASGKLEVHYLYRIERNFTRELHPNPLEVFPFDLPLTKASLAGGIVMDRRDDVFDATAGWLHASNVEYSPAWLSPDTRLAKLVAEQRYYRRAGPVVLASWGRFGLATGFDQPVLSIDRFFAGGGNSVRGYAEEALSPADALGLAGGNVLLVLNQEVRFPLFPYVRGVGFIDAGRAFETLGQMSLKALSAGTGVGFRVQTPVVLLRFDMGIPLDASAGPRRPRWFFSIGQMF